VNNSLASRLVKDPQAMRKRKTFLKCKNEHNTDSETRHNLICVMEETFGQVPDYKNRSLLCHLYMYNLHLLIFCGYLYLDIAICVIYIH